MADRSKITWWLLQLGDETPEDPASIQPGSPELIPTQASPVRERDVTGRSCPVKRRMPSHKAHHCQASDHLSLPLDPQCLVSRSLRRPSFNPTALVLSILLLLLFLQANASTGVARSHPASLLGRRRHPEHSLTLPEPNLHHSLPSLQDPEEKSLRLLKLVLNQKRLVPFKMMHRLPHYQTRT